LVLHRRNKVKVVKTEVIPEYAVPEQLLTHVVRYSCDLCGKESVDERKWPASDNSSYTQATTVIEFEHTYKGGSFYSRHNIAFHLCANCFEAKLIPWFRSQGAVATESSQKIRYEDEL
jgi:hypothetical protein